MRAFIALALLAAPTAHAGPHELSLGGTTRTLRTDSANALTEDSLGGGQLGYAHALDLPLMPGVALWATGTFGWGAADGTMFQTLTTELDTLSFSVGGRARYPLRGRWLAATARLDLGTSRAAVALRDDAGHSAADTGWGATAQGAVGIDLALIRPRTRDFSLGIRVELGYVIASPIALTATPESGSEGTLQLEMSAASLGSVNLSGAVFGAMVTSQF